MLGLDAKDVKGVENDKSLIPQRSDEVSSTLPQLEEEPQNSSYAAAGGIGKTAEEGVDDPNHRAKGRLRML